MVVDRSRTRNSGQAAVLVIITVVVIMALAWGVVTLSVRAAHRSRAQTAADAAALAGVRGGSTEAARAAMLNGATMIDFMGSGLTNGDSVTVKVTVSLGDETATALASNVP